MDRIASMAVFAKAVEAGSFSAAADALSMSSQMVGKHVRTLEDHLGVKLINRTTRRQSVTELGRAFHDRVRTILAEVEAAEALAAESRAVPRGRIRVNAPVTFGAHELARVLPGYLEANPEVDVELTLADRTVDLVDEGYDAVFRVGSLSDSGLIARALRPLEMLLCAAPAYVEAHGAPATPDELRAHECLGFAYGTTRNRWSFSGPGGPVTVDVPCRHVANNGQALLTLALAGMGIFLQPVALVRDDLASGRLVHLLPDFVPPTHPMHVLYAPDRRITPKLRSFVDFAVAQFG
ncbi:LysR family transcriptional regulator [Methylobacterium soli]|uniref:LysR family transcriptional regulator n=1 Tax=Methylobacterium soli TaxID=553447 RepID=A0A6L3SX36_9HYPH|nr:LysR family transcriptional regulator [Methylobacterium soli]KAB1076745.1 LysR family transcriptional regulator [Methylobacterium soli]GJE45837.1 HTH-type transcriptional regulator DmlR [Methylobacterium soli]